MKVTKETLPKDIISKYNWSWVNVITDDGKVRKVYLVDVDDSFDLYDHINLLYNLDGNDDYANGEINLDNVVSIESIDEVMIMSSHAKVTTKILKYLNDCYENGLELDIESLNANRLDISDRQYYQTLNMLSDDGYIKGIEFLDVIANHPITLS